MTETLLLVRSFARSLRFGCRSSTPPSTQFSRQAFRKTCGSQEVSILGGARDSVKRINKEYALLGSHALETKKKSHAIFFWSACAAEGRRGCRRACRGARLRPRGRRGAHLRRAVVPRLFFVLLTLLPHWLRGVIVVETGKPFEISSIENSVSKFYETSLYTTIQRI